MTKVDKPVNQGSVQDPKVSSFQRQQTALHLRAAGASYAKIAKKLGYAGRSGAHKSVTSAMKKLQVESVQELRTLHSVRIGEIILKLWSERGDPPAARALLACLERESRLFGLDAPTDVRLTTGEEEKFERAVVLLLSEMLSDDQAKEFSRRLPEAIAALKEST